MRKIVAVIAVASALGAYAEERTVSTAADLVAALEALNAASAPAEPNVIYLEPGSYDVSAYSMANWGSSGKTSTFAKHIALANSGSRRRHKFGHALERDRDLLQFWNLGRRCGRRHMVRLYLTSSPSCPSHAPRLKRTDCPLS